MKNLQERNFCCRDLMHVLLTKSCLNRQAAHWSLLKVKKSDKNRGVLNGDSESHKLRMYRNWQTEGGFHLKNKVLC